MLLIAPSSIAIPINVDVRLFEDEKIGSAGAPDSCGVSVTAGECRAPDQLAPGDVHVRHRARSIH